MARFACSAKSLPATPALDSQAYADAYTEVFDYGGDGINTPTIRTAEQTEIGEASPQLTRASGLAFRKLAQDVRCALFGEHRADAVAKEKTVGIEVEMHGSATDTLACDLAQRGKDAAFGCMAAYAEIGARKPGD